MEFRRLIFVIVFAVAIAAAWLVCCRFTRADDLGRFIGAIGVLAMTVFLIWLSLAPERRFWRELSSREPLDDVEFFRRFYADQGVSADIPRRLRPIYCRFFDIEVGKLRPLDRPPEIVEIDLVDLIRDIETEFSVTITDKDAERIDGSFDSVVRFLVERSGSAAVDRRL